MCTTAFASYPISWLAPEGAVAVAVWHFVSSAKGVMVTDSFHHTSAIQRVDLEDVFWRADMDADAKYTAQPGPEEEDAGMANNSTVVMPQAPSGCYPADPCL